MDNSYVQVVVTGIALGCGYGLIGLGFSLTYRTMGVLNFAQGDLAILGGYLAYGLMAAGLPIVVACLVAVACLGVIAIAFERTVIRPLMKRGLVVTIIATLGLSAVIEAALQLGWGSQTLNLSGFGAGRSFGIGIATITELELEIVIVTVAVGIAMAVTLRRSPLGRRMHAVAVDRASSRLMGLNVEALLMLAAGLSGMVAAVGGLFLGAQFGLAPSEGVSIAIPAFAGAVVGGLASPIGAIVGSVIVSVVGNVASLYISPSYEEVVVYGLLILVLILYPRGIFGDRLAGARRV